MSINRVVVDDNIFMKTKVSAAGSKYLFDFVPPVNAAVIDKLINSGVNEIIQSGSNEFGISLTESFGCVSSLAEGEAHVGIGCDVNGAIRKQASQAGVCFIKPTYGMVSRYGLVSTAPSMEQIGVACSDIDEGFKTLSIISGFDERDGTLAGKEKYDFKPPESEGLQDIKIAVPDMCKDGLREMAERLKALGARVESVDFSCLKYVPGVYHIIASAEICNSLSRFDGLKFGHRAEKCANLEDIYIKSRTESFTLETKLMILMGIHVLAKENFEGLYQKSMKLRREIKNSSDEIFESYDAVMTPADDLKYLALPNLIGTPAVSIPGNAQFLAKETGEDALYRIGRRLMKGGDGR